MPLRRPRPALLVVALSTLAVVGFVLWSLWAHLDQVTRVQGRVIPSGRTQIVQSADGGTIAAILVREGDRVRTGQVLIRLDAVRMRAAVDESASRVAAFKAAMARIQAELFDRPLRFPAETDGYVSFQVNQRELYQRRRAALGAHLASQRRMLALARSELQMNLPLVQTGDVSRSEILRMQRGAAELEGQIANRQNQYFEELQADYTKTEEQLASAQEELTQRRSALTNTELRSPADGVVTNIRLTTLGGVLKPGDEVLQVVPSADELVVEAKVPPADIAFIRIGQRASVKFDAYDSAIYGAGLGRVRYLSADTVSEQTPHGPQSFYRVRLGIDPSTLRPRHPGERIMLQPGMTATAEIITGETTVFQFLAKPILKTTSESMGER